MKARQWLTALFLGIALTALAIGAAIEIHTQRWLATAAATDGVITELLADSEGSFAPIAQFRVDDRVMHWGSGVFTNPAAFAVGERVRVFYQPENPQDAAIDSWLALHFASAITGGIGLAFGIAGLVLLLARRAGARQAARLRQQGARQTAAMTLVQLDQAAKTPVWRIHAQAADRTHGVVRTFVSEPLGFDPAAFIGSRKTVDVLFDPARPGRYLIDLSWLPRHVG